MFIYQRHEEIWDQVRKLLGGTPFGSLLYIKSIQDYKTDFKNQKQE